MKKKFKIYISLFCIILFFPLKSLASTIQCNLFVDNLLSSPTDHKWEKVIGDIYLNDFGFILQYDWDDKNKKKNQNAWKVSVDEIKEYNLDVKNPSDKEETIDLAPHELIDNILKDEEKTLQLLQEVKDLIQKEIPK